MNFIHKIKKIKNSGQQLIAIIRIQNKNAVVYIIYVCVLCMYTQCVCVLCNIFIIHIHTHTHTHAIFKKNMLCLIFNIFIYNL